MTTASPDLFRFLRLILSVFGVFCQMKRCFLCLVLQFLVVVVGYRFLSAFFRVAVAAELVVVRSKSGH